jgi:hypothetical protein
MIPNGRTMIRNCLVALALSLPAACAGDPEEAAPAPGAESITGALADEQRYPVPVAEAMKAAETALRSGDFKIERKRRDDCGGKIVARREDGHRVTVTIHAPERAVTEIAVYTEPADRRLVEFLHARIASTLGLKKAQAELFGETTLEASYEVDLETGMAAAENACRTLALEVTLKRQDQDRARLEARDIDARPVRFALRRTAAPSAETEVVLSTETVPGGGEKEFLRRIRRELERRLFPSSE